MTEDDLLARYPLLWHMAEDGSWPSIRAHGLLSTTALLDLYGVAGERRRALEAARRPRLVTLTRDGLPGAVLGDQTPMSDRGLLACLRDGITPAQWYAILNAKVFFWVSRERLDRLLRARSYRSRPHTVLMIDTRSLLAAHRDRVRLCAINSGATLHKAQPRGLDTFLPIAAFPSDATGRQRPGRQTPVELVVAHSVPDIAAHVAKVERVACNLSADGPEPRT